MLGRLPLAFVENRGQWEAPARFIARRGGMTAWIGSDGLTLQLARREEDERVTGVVVRLVFEGVLETAALEGEGRQPGIHNFFLGNDPSRWRTDVPGYASVLYRGLREGVDLRVREETGRLEYDVILAPGADLEGVVVRCDGTEGIEVGPDGSLAMETALGSIRQSPPVAWLVLPGGDRKPIAARFRLHGPDRYGFEVSGRDPSLAIVIDPGLLYSTLLGGSSYDRVLALALDSSGAATVAGLTAFPGGLSGSPLPTTPGAYDTSFNGGVDDAFVARLSLLGNGAADLLYSTILGGSASENVYALALDATGAATVAGRTDSPNLPTTPGAYDTAFDGGPFWGDAFVARLSPSGNALLYSTFLGGVSDESASALALDATGAATVVGHTESPGFPSTPGAYDTTFNGSFWPDGFVARLSLSGNGAADLLYATFLGGSDADGVSDLALDATGAPTVAGSTLSSGFPTTPAAYDTTFNGPSNGDAFVARLSLAGNGAADLLYSTFLGGSGIPYGEGASAVALDATGAATVVGWTGSSDFPTTFGACDTTFDGGTADVFVARLSPSGNALLYSTFLGGPFTEAAYAVALDATGAATVAGTAFSAFPTTPGAYSTTYNGVVNEDSFLARLSLAGNGAADLLYSTYLGGSLGDLVRPLALDAMGAATVAGGTESADFPTTPGAFATTLNVLEDVFVARLDLLPAGASSYGASTSGCAGPLAIGVTSWPQVGNAGFALTCGNAPPTAAGLLALSGAALPTPLVVLGADVWIDLSSVLLVPVSSNAIGAALTPIPIPPSPPLVGGQVFAQFFWGGPTSPTPCPPGGISASNALALVVQP